MTHDTYPDQIEHSSGITMTRTQDRVLVSPRTTPAASPDGRTMLDGLGLVPESDNRPDESPVADSEPSPRELPPVNDGPDLVFARTADGAAVDEGVIDAATRSGNLAWSSPVYSADLGAGAEQFAPAADALALRHGDVTDESDLASLAALGLVRDEARSDLMGDLDYFTIADPATTPAYRMGERIAAALGREIEVRLEWVPLRVPVAQGPALTPNDPLYGAQWGLRQIRAAGDGPHAWQLTHGSPAIIVAILDEGVELGHPDLAGAFVNRGINLGTMSGTGAPTGNHGTPCAGIVAARTGNGAGVAGVAGRCRILPIAFARWTDTEVAAGLRYAVRQGAHVASMSFGSNAWSRAVIDPAIEEAYNAGMVMCVATHNQNRANGVTYPATNPLVIAVGASDQSDNRKSPSSPDGETWGSNYGPQVSVVAPGVRIPTTDRLADAGYDGGDYTGTFNGTSSATPLVAGVAALIRSQNPSLSNREVRRIIETTADKVGPTPYATSPGHPHGTWNQELGYGRINAYAAVVAAGRPAAAGRPEAPRRDVA